MKRTTRIALSLAVIALTLPAFAQMGPPTPAPELKKLDYFVGSWTMEATIAPGPWGAGGKFTQSDQEEWMKGGFYLVNHSDFSMPPELGGAGNSLAVLGYDADNKTYTEDRFDSMGRHAVMTGALNGDTLTWSGSNDYNGMEIKSHLIVKMVSPTSYTVKYEVSADGGASWMPFFDGKATKK